MFFIGIFGIQAKQEVVESRQGEICPVCGSLDRYEILKEYQYFHIFFLPVWRWGERYLVRTRCCQQVRILPHEFGKALVRGEAADWSQLSQGVLDPLVRCAHCSTLLEPEYRYCPRCGSERD
jgi:RNA polymerase subunit RPABC4/transcription elongation factor Spt4